MSTADVTLCPYTLEAGEERPASLGADRHPTNVTDQQSHRVKTTDYNDFISKILR